MENKINLNSIITNGNHIESDIDKCIYYSNCITFISELYDTISFQATENPNKDFILKEVTDYLHNGLASAINELRAEIYDVIKKQEVPISTPVMQMPIQKRELKWKVKR